MATFSFAALVRINIHLILLFGENLEREEHRVQILFYESFSRPLLSSKFFSFKITTHFNRFIKNLVFLSRFSANTREQHSHIICCSSFNRQKWFSGISIAFSIESVAMSKLPFFDYFISRICFIYVFCFFNTHQSRFSIN